MEICVMIPYTKSRVISSSVFFCMAPKLGYAKKGQFLALFGPKTPLRNKISKTYFISFCSPMYEKKKSVLILKLVQVMWAQR